MAEVVIGRCHGGWSPSDGYTQVPAGSALYLFVDPMRSMWSDQSDDAVMGSAQHLQSLQSRATKIEEYRSICNYSTSDLEPDDEVAEGPLQQGVEIVQGGKTLAQVFQDYPSSNIYWFACQVNVLAPAGGEEAGAYQGQDFDPS